MFIDFFCWRLKKPLTLRYNVSFVHVGLVWYCSSEIEIPSETKKAIMPINMKWLWSFMGFWAICWTGWVIPLRMFWLLEHLGWQKCSVFQYCCQTICFSINYQSGFWLSLVPGWLAVWAFLFAGPFSDRILNNLEFSKVIIKALDQEY